MVNCNVLLSFCIRLVNEKKTMDLRKWGITKDNKIEIVSLTADKLEDALEVLRRGFFKDENVCRAVELIKNPKAVKELEQLCINAAKAGISLIAMDKETNKVVGVAFNLLQVENTDSEPYYVKFMNDYCKENSSRAVIQFMLDVDDYMNLYKYCNTKCILEIMFLGVLPDYRERGIGKALIAACIELGRRLKKGENVRVAVYDALVPLESPPDIATAVFTSFISQKIGKSLNFEKVVDIDYDKFTFKGKTYKESIGSHTAFTTLEFFRF